MKFSETVSEIVDKGIAVSKKMVGQAGDAVQKFSDKSVVRLEKRQYEMKKDSQIKELGRIAAAFFITDGKSELCADDASIQDILETIRVCDAEISRREEILKEDKAKRGEKAEENKDQETPGSDTVTEVSACDEAKASEDDGDS